MKKIDCIFYLVDNYIYLYDLKNNNLDKYKFNNLIYEGRIIKQNNLVKKLNEILKEKKLIKILTGQKAIIIYEAHLKYIDKKIIIDTFDQCGFKDIKLISTKELVDKNKYYLEINNNYIITYYYNKYELIRINSYLNLETLIKLIIKKINSDILLIGINNNIEKMVDISKKLYYLENSDLYFIDRIIKKINKNWQNLLIFFCFML